MCGGTIQHFGSTLVKPVYYMMGVHHLQSDFLKWTSSNNSSSVVTNYRLNIQQQSASAPTVMSYGHTNVAQFSAK